MKNVENRSYISGATQFHQTGMSARSKQKDRKNNWVDRSRAVREAMMASINID